METPGGLVLHGHVGYADALVALIPGEVVRTADATGVGLRIEFASAAIALHPRFDGYSGPEIAYLSGFADGQWMCWRPGEESFEDVA